MLTDRAAHLPTDLWEHVAERRLAIARMRTGSPPVPLAFLANPSDGAGDLVWGEPRPLDPLKALCRAVEASGAHA